MSTQSKKSSLVESVLNTIIATLGGLAVGPLVYWAWNVPISVMQFGGVTFTFLVISILRNYLLRRWFETRRLKKLKKEKQNENKEISGFL